MSSEFETEIDAVIRLRNVALPRDEIESKLGLPLDRFESSKRDKGSYGQLNIAAEGGWTGLITLMDHVGPAIRDCVERREMGKPEVDVGWAVGGYIVASSLCIPPAVTAAVARFGFKLVVSAYLTE